jgi:hypothetical protein
VLRAPASPDAVNRAPSTSYSEVTGITQTSRNFGASLGLAVLGAILIAQNNIHVVNALTKAGVPSGIAHNVASSLGTAGPGSGGGGNQPAALVHDVQLAFAHSIQTVFYIMAGVMAFTFLVALRWLPGGRVAPAEEAQQASTPAEQDLQTTSGG